jgi:hypothetical protein
MESKYGLLHTYALSSLVPSLSLYFPLPLPSFAHLISLYLLSTLLHGYQVLLPLLLYFLSSSGRCRPERLTMHTRELSGMLYCVCIGSRRVGTVNGGACM